MKVKCNYRLQASLNQLPCAVAGAMLHSAKLNYWADITRQLFLHSSEHRLWIFQLHHGHAKAGQALHDSPPPQNDLLHCIDLCMLEAHEQLFQTQRSIRIYICVSRNVNVSLLQGWCKAIGRENINFHLH